MYTEMNSGPYYKPEKRYELTDTETVREEIQAAL